MYDREQTRRRGSVGVAIKKYASASALKLEWSLLDRRRRERKNTDIDGLVYEDEIEDIPDLSAEALRSTQDPDEMMVDTIAEAEERELNAMLSMLETQPSSQAPLRHDSPSMSDDDDYDSLFMDLLCQQQQQSSSPQLVLSGQMDIS
ncbi:hypothetical protein SLS62_001915 [Diatrype stigma]|uniref:Uncharacterized protein n=1 Tax=Diatrype stigma TaxID=117547 RepID=A0AAN9YR81_9PEZI